jgi:plasmid stabilization system protein ParE
LVIHPRKLILRDGALRDLARHEHHLGAVRGTAFAEAWSESLIDWLEYRASLGAQFGTEHPMHPGYRTFGYRRQATILAEFTEDAMDVIRIRFTGEDWQE